MTGQINDPCWSVANLPIWFYQFALTVKHISGMYQLAGHLRKIFHSLFFRELFESVDGHIIIDFISFFIGVCGSLFVDFRSIAITNNERGAG